MRIGRRMRTARNSIYNFKKRGLSGQLTWHVIYENSTFRLIKRDPNLILPRIYLKKENIYLAMLGIQLIEHLPPIQITYRGTDTETTLIPWIDLEFAQNPPRIFANIIHICIYRVRNARRTQVGQRVMHPKRIEIPSIALVQISNALKYTIIALELIAFTRRITKRPPTNKSKIGLDSSRRKGTNDHATMWAQPRCTKPRPLDFH